MPKAIKKIYELGFHGHILRKKTPKNTITQNNNNPIRKS